MKCRVCGIVKVDGRKHTICDKCSKNLDKRKRFSDRIDSAIRDYIEDAIYFLVTDKDIKDETWKMQYTQKMIMQAVSFAILERNPGLWYIFREVEGYDHEFFYILEDRVEKYVSEWFRTLIR